MQLESLFSTYLDAYASKNEQAIANMFAENITLRDWQIAVSGKVAALKETRQNFQAAESIAIKILSMYTAKNSIAGELEITVNGTEVLYVVDVLTFDAHNKIASIRAYLGRAD